MPGKNAYRTRKDGGRCRQRRDGSNEVKRTMILVGARAEIVASELIKSYRALIEWQGRTLPCRRDWDAVCCHANDACSHQGGKSRANGTGRGNRDRLFLYCAAVCRECLGGFLHIMTCLRIACQGEGAVRLIANALESGASAVARPRGARVAGTGHVIASPPSKGCARACDEKNSREDKLELGPGLVHLESRD